MAQIFREITLEKQAYFCPIAMKIKSKRKAKNDYRGNVLGVKQVFL